MKKNIFKSLLITILIFAMMFAVAGCGDVNEPAEDEGTEVKTYYVGTEPTFKPFEYTDEESGEIIGFDIDLIKAIAEDQGFNVEVQNLGFDGLITAVQTGNIDIIASGMTIKPERAEKVDFSTPYINSGLALAVPQDNDTITSVEDLKGKSVAVQIGTTGAGKAQELVDAGIVKEVKTFNTIDVVMMELTNGGVDAVINDFPVTNAFIKKQPGKIKIVGDPITSESYGFAVQKGNTELLEMINNGLQNAIDNGTYEQLENKYDVFND